MTYEEQIKLERIKFWTAVWLGCDGSCTIEKATEIADNALAYFDKRFVAKKTSPTENSVEGSDGWVEWSGGECPVSENTKVHIKLRDGYLSKEVHTADQYRWLHTVNPENSYISGLDIVAYKVVKEND